ncbi:hypothetical protein [Selenomonas sp. AB3002]|uniref:hypothetical protein n=1 Tax=Selenomonas sp. AB3002 TaxID=1392502 RepID=UPI000497017E
MKKIIQTTIQEEGKSYQDTLRAIEDELLATYGCLLPSGEVTVTLVMPWTKEGVLGELKRQGKILAWKLDKAYEEGNNRRYLITLDADRI